MREWESQVRDWCKGVLASLTLCGCLREVHYSTVHVPGAIVLIANRRKAARLLAPLILQRASSAGGESVAATAE